MADAKISSFASHGTPVGEDYVASVLASGPTSKRLLLSDIRDYDNMLYSASSADANIALAINTLHVVDISGYTADRTATLPAVFAVGDRVGLFLSTGDTAFELLYTATAGDTCNGVAGGTEVSRLFITNECVIFRGIVANTTWIVEYDGRIPMKGLIELTTAATTNTANTFVYASANSGVWTSRIDVGNIVDTATEKITMRRACKGQLAVGARSNSTVTDQNYTNGAAELNASATFVAAPFYLAAMTGLNAQTSGTVAATFAAGDYVRHMFRNQEANKGLAVSASSYLSFLEALP